MINFPYLPSLPSSLSAINSRKTLPIIGISVLTGENRELVSISKYPSGCKPRVSYFRQCLTSAVTMIKGKKRARATDYYPTIKTETRKTMER